MAKKVEAFILPMTGGRVQKTHSTILQPFEHD